MYNINWYAPSKAVVASTKWRTLKSLYEHKLLLLALKCFDLSPAPIAHLFTKNIHQYNLRRMTFTEAKHNTNFVRKSICQKAVTLWNSINNETRKKQYVDHIYGIFTFFNFMRIVLNYCD